MEANQPQLRCPRGVTAVMVGRGRICYYSGVMEAPTEVRAAGTEFVPGELTTMLRGLIESKTLRGRIALGFEPQAEFFVTERKVQQLGKFTGMLEKLAGELGQEMVGRELDTSLPEELFSTAIMVPGGRARDARRGLGKLGQSSVRLISTTHALHAAALATAGKKSARAEVEIRVIAQSGRGMALLSQKGSLLARHVFEFSQARDFAVINAVRRLLGVARDSLHLDADPVVVIQAECEADFLQRLQAELSIETRQAAVVDLNDTWCCAALARCAFQRNGYVSIIQSGERALGGEPAGLPMKGMVAALSALAAVGFWMNMSASELDAEIHNQNTSAVEVLQRFGEDIYELRDQEEQLAMAAYLTGRFAQDRVLWAPLLAELPQVLPAGMAMETFEGSYPFYFTAADPSAATPFDEIASNRWCELSATAAAAGGDAPPQAQMLSIALQNSDVFRAAFRRVSGASIVLHDEDAHPWAESRVRCLAR